MSLANFLLRPSTFLLLSSPPASGKTSLVLDLYYHYPQKMVFLSPLRALAVELYERTRREGIKSCLLTKKGEVGARDYVKKRRFLLIATVETLDEKLWGAFEQERPLFIVDEFHLFYSWGEDFRPLLREGLMRAANIGVSILALSATVSGEMLKKCRTDFSLGMEEAYFVDRGNRRFLHPPEKIIFMGWGGKRTFRLMIGHCLAKEKRENFLIFCRYRHEVKNLVGLLRRRGVNALGCVGGEVAHFQEAMKEKTPEVIVSTSCLSHGVNLPALHKVFIAYREKSHDMWLQMSARGGRKGEKFLLYQCNRFSLSPFAVAGQYLRLLIVDFFYRFLILLGL